MWTTSAFLLKSFQRMAGVFHIIMRWLLRIAKRKYVLVEAMLGEPRKAEQCVAANGRFKTVSAIYFEIA
jgi:hypothetical protein